MTLPKALITAISDGKYDDDLDRISRLVQARRDSINQQKMYTLYIGDKVVFNSRTRPDYLVGATATVVKLNRKTVKVQLDSPRGRFSGLVTTGLSLIDPVH